MRRRFWRWVHIRINHLAWRYAVPAPHECSIEECGADVGQHGPTWGIAPRLDETHPLWRLNNWAADRWLPAYWREFAERRGIDDHRG